MDRAAALVWRLAKQGKAISAVDACGTGNAARLEGASDLLRVKLEHLTHWVSKADNCATFDTPSVWISM